MEKALADENIVNLMLTNKLWWYTLSDPPPSAQSRFDLRLLNIKQNSSLFVSYMTQIETVTEEDLLVSLTFHNFSAEMIKEFAQKIVRPYFNGNMNQAIRSLMEKAIQEETLVEHTILTKPK